MINIYPAFLQGNNVIHADDWDEGSTIELNHVAANVLINALNLSHLVQGYPSNVRLRTIEMAMTMNGADTNRYVPKLKQLCAVARIKKASHIIFA